jgi:Na+-translocating ferredoxin:NAD+ oxidoreductase RnfD subunit
MTFGGLGCNLFNPALAGRAFLLISFPTVLAPEIAVGIPIAVLALIDRSAAAVAVANDVHGAVTVRPASGKRMGNGRMLIHVVHIFLLL